MRLHRRYVVDIEEQRWAHSCSGFMSEKSSYMTSDKVW